MLWVEDCSGRVADPTNGEVILNVPDRTFRLTKIKGERGTLPTTSHGNDLWCLIDSLFESRGIDCIH